MALGFAGQVVAAQMLVTDYEVLQNEQIVLIDGHVIELNGKDFHLVFEWMYLNEWEKLSNVIDERYDGIPGGQRAIEDIVAAFEERVDERIANGVVG